MIKKYINSKFKIALWILGTILYFLYCQIIIASENNVTDNVADNLEMNSFLQTFEDYIEENGVEDFSAISLYNDLISGNGADYSSIFSVILDNLLEQVVSAIKSVISIFLIIVIIAIVSCIQLDENSDVVKITKLVIVISISSILLKNYLEIVVMFKNIVNILSIIMQVVTTFLLGVLMFSGKITSTGIIEPMLLFITNAICVITEYIIIPFFTISIAISIISRIADNVKMDNLSKMFGKASLYIFSGCIAIFVFILSMESSVTKSIDNLYYKSAQTVISNVVPVVGGFLSDSLSTVLGATELIGKVGGAVALICTTIIVSIPILKLIAIIVLYNLLISISEPICSDKNIEEFLKSFAEIYKDMLGILIGIMVLFVMSTGIIMGIISNISG